MIRGSHTAEQPAVSTATLAAAPTTRIVIQRLLPLAVSVVLLAVIIGWVSPAALWKAAMELRWQLLLPATALMVVALYLWDAACLPLVYGVDGQSISYRQSLRLRGLTYLAGALNYELGQAALAWGMGRVQQVSLVRMLARSILLAYHDILVLLGAGLVGSLLTNDPRVERVRPFLAIGLLAALVVGAVFWAMPERLRTRFRIADTASFLTGWSLRRSLQLLPMRLVYFGILVGYAVVALAICQMPIDYKVVLSTVPLVLLADGLPNFSGLGTRETTLQLLLTPDKPAVLLAMSLFWSTGMMVGRFIIGLANLLGRQSFQVSRA